MPSLGRFLIALALTGGFARGQSDAPQIYRAPAGIRPVQRGGGPSILPGGRIIAPFGEEYATGPGAYGLAVSPAGHSVATSNGGPVRYSLTILEQSSGNKGWEARQVVAHTPETLDQADAADWQSVFMGLAFTGEHTLYASEGNSGRVGLFDASDQRRRIIDLNQNGMHDSYSGDLAFDAPRHILYAVDQANFRVAAIDVRTGRVVASVRVGRLPFALALSPDARKLYVTNLGMFEYRQLPGDGIPFPGFGFPSPEALAALGDPNAQESNSVAVLDVGTPAAAKVEAFIHIGIPWGAGVEGGSSPSGVATSAHHVFVSNAADDSVTVIDAQTNAIEAEIPIRIPGLEEYRGVLPMGLDYQESSGRLLVAEAGINAVGVIDVPNKRVLGHIPAAWFPTRVALSGGMVFVANAKGHGVGPTAPGLTPFPGGALPGRLYQGSLSVFRLPSDEELAALTATVMESNGFRPAPPAASAAPSLPPIRHVVLIVKESRSYDEVLGDMTSASNGPVMSAPGLARFGANGMVDGKHQRLSLKQVDLTPNHHAIARRWSFSDNFYSDAEGSVDGHHWLVGAYPNAWVDSSMRAAYGNLKDFRLSAAPGRLSFPGMAASVAPEDLPEAGTLWHHLARHGVTFLNFGEGFELAGVQETHGQEPTGARFYANLPMPEPLFTNTSRSYPGFNLEISDQYRADHFIQEIQERFVTGGAELPSLLYVHLPGDYFTRARPQDGYRYEESYMADNDYALGRILEFLSHTKWWREMAVFVTEADAQGGYDHIDSHRTVLLAAGPWFKKNYVSHVNTSFPGLLKTVFRLLGLPPLNLYDAAASDLSDCFTAAPDYTAYQAVPPDKRVFLPPSAPESR